MNRGGVSGEKDPEAPNESVAAPLLGPNLRVQAANEGQAVDPKLVGSHLQRNMALDSNHSSTSRQRGVCSLNTFLLASVLTGI
jgi:hypothetical protein